MMRSGSCVLVLAMIGCAGAAPPPPTTTAPPATATVEARPQLLVVGFAHLDNPGLDLANVTVDDVLAPRRQAEIAGIVDRLAAFRPTRVAVEMKSARQPELDERYRAFRAGSYALGRSETDQIGLRLAARLGHDRVYAVDWNEMPPGTEADYDFVTYAPAHGKQSQLDALMAGAQAQAAALAPGSTPLLDWLRGLNEPAALAASHRRYFEIARIGDASVNPGAAWVGSWYGRNLRIFANLVALAERPDDRVLVVYGQGHAFLLREFAAQSGAFVVADPVAVLDGR
jgi:hypothetical protein